MKDSPIYQYLDSINKRFKLGNSTEHTFRGDLQQLIEKIVPTIRATNEPKRQKCGAPDYILTRKDVPVGFIEAKDIGDTDLDGIKKAGHKEQFDRYKAALSNLIFTDYLDFHLYREGQFITSIQIGKIIDNSIVPIYENFESFQNLINDFCLYKGQTIKSSKKLAEMMAGKARLLSDAIGKVLTSDEDNSEDSTLKDQMQAFKRVLIHDITPKGFADIYAQTITYGLFAARLRDPSLETFSRQEAYELIPKSNPFLKKLFGYIAGLDIDDRIKWIVDDLITIFLACNVENMLKNYGKTTQKEDPIIHFYEDFLSEYDPKLRKARGVWYTPAPVVSFIVRAVDDILKTEFDLPQGLADTSKTKIKVDVQGKKNEQEVHKVQILDPAAGTGTFLAEVIKLIYKKFEGQQGIWSSYVENHLLPRLNGFELLMASYAMAHLKLDLLLSETGFKPTKDQRLRVFLTNSLEKHHPDTGTLWANWLSTEANEANHIKRDTPVMCIIGNPPYAVSSTNKNDWIEKLISDYKRDLDEKSYNSLSDDYVKFIRYGQHFVEKNGSGILAYISNSSFIDGIVFRQMRKNLLECFDKIYILNLHGNAKKKEVCQDGSSDQNVFDIMQGVSINIFIKTGKKKKNDLGKVFNFDLFGKREHKYEYLINNNLNSADWQKLNYSEPNYFFVQKSFINNEKYDSGFKVDELFPINSVGIVTSRDAVLIGYSKEELTKQVETYYNIHIDQTLVIRVDYRTFDKRFIYYNTKLIDRARDKVMRHIMQKNTVLNIPKQAIKGFNHIFVGNSPCDKNFIDSAGQFGAGNAFPLYIYPETNGQQINGQTTERTPNLNAEIVKQIAAKLGLTFTNEKETTENTFAPINILDYIYAVLHSPTYRKKYKEFLKIDFPRVPYPKDKTTFWQLVKLGGELRLIHLLESPLVNNFITQYPEDGDNTIEKIKYSSGKLFINEKQYFGNVPEIAWNFYIGGYQPAQKWLKDRKNRKLSFEDIIHYQKIIVALTETDSIMKEIDKVNFE